MLTPMLMPKPAAQLIDSDSPLLSLYPGASLRDRATLPSPLAVSSPPGGYRSLRAPLAGRRHAALDPRNSLSSDPIAAILGAYR